MPTYFPLVYIDTKFVYVWVCMLNLNKIYMYLICDILNYKINKFI